jgi:hypothetical protein
MGIVMASSKYPSTHGAGYYTSPSDSHKIIFMDTLYWVIDIYGDSLLVVEWLRGIRRQRSIVSIW